MESSLFGRGRFKEILPKIKQQVESGATVVLAGVRHQDFRPRSHLLMPRKTTILTCPLRSIRVFLQLKALFGITYNSRNARVSIGLLVFAHPPWCLRRVSPLAAFLPSYLFHRLCQVLGLP